MPMFPLGDWVNGHEHVRHHLAHSGMVGALRSLPVALRERWDPDDQILRSEIAKLYSVADDRVFLTHGTSEANGVVQLFLHREATHRRVRVPRLYVRPVEYPPLRDAGRALGFRVQDRPTGADVVALSSPANPLGTRVETEEIERLARNGRPVLVDQIFREFTTDLPITRRGPASAWLTSSFTKAYGADSLRVGFAICPAGQEESFATVHGLMLNKVPLMSVAGARAILHHRNAILSEARSIFRENARTLHRSIREVPPLAAPVWFDRGVGGLDGDRLQLAALEKDVLVASGSFFGDPRGVRICLTRRTFRADLEAYLRVRESFL
ncbi:MAG: pyridoxal phosphate-dependent aminotransferase [Thermoplasmata archaeon]|nr:pyridoxal phosphate-dependent aminotransferase [Thermoplasmata archaeon]